MATIEERLTSALTEGSDHLQLPAGAARHAWRRGRRRHHQLVAVGAGVGIVVVGAATAGVVSAATAPHLRVGTTSTRTAVTPGASPTSAPMPCPRSETIGSIPPAAAALAAVCLPDPAPGFPLERRPGDDTTAVTGGGLLKNDSVIRTFRVSATAPIVTKQPSGATLVTPTGQEATVFIALDGAFPTTPDAVAAADVYPVIGTTTALGTTATIVQVEAGEDSDQIGVLVSAGGFDIAAYGGQYGTIPPVTTAQLVTLIDSIQGLPGN